MVNKFFNNAWEEFNPLLFTCGSIALSSVHEVLSLVGLGVSITYAVIKINKEIKK